MKLAEKALRDAFRNKNVNNWGHRRKNFKVHFAFSKGVPKRQPLAGNNLGNMHSQSGMGQLLISDLPEKQLIQLNIQFDHTQYKDVDICVLGVVKVWIV